MFLGVSTILGLNLPKSPILIITGYKWNILLWIFILGVTTFYRHQQVKSYCYDLRLWDVNDLVSIHLMCFDDIYHVDLLVHDITYYYFTSFIVYNLSLCDWTTWNILCMYMCLLCISLLSSNLADNIERQSFKELILIGCQDYS